MLSVLSFLCRTQEISQDEDIAVTKFREYLRVNTEQPAPNYEACKEFLFNLAAELGIETKALELAPGKPIIIMTIQGSHPDLPSIVLYSHTDVVPAFVDKWTYPPYSGHKDKNGLIYGRGAQDMKSVGSQYFEAIRRHFLKGKRQWDRTIHLIYGPDEEIGSADGMAKFVTTETFRNLNVGFWLDEGQASESYAYKVYYAEKNQWWLKVICEGTPGHGSKFVENTAGEKMLSFIQSALAFREEQKNLYRKSANKSLSDVITLNLTRVEGGQAVNVLPTKFTIYLDIRLPPSADFDKMEECINSWCKKAGKGVTYEYLTKSMNKQMTPTDKSDPYFAAFHRALLIEKCTYEKEVFSGGTDSRFLRQLGYRAIGFSPMNFTPVLLHAHDESIHEKIFLRGVQIYSTVIDCLASVPA